MPKAAIGAGEIAGGIALDFVPGGQLFGTMLLQAGIGTEAAQISQALGNQNTLAITTRAPAALRQVIRGTQRVGGVMVYASTTGGEYDQYNMVIVLAGHQCWAIENLYLDGRRVYWNVGSVGNGISSRNGYNFGGSAATSGGLDGSGTYVGPNGQHYNFGTLVYCEARYGDQPDHDVIGGLTANDPNWTNGAAGYPSLLGCTYVYLKVEYDSAMFPNFPEVRFTVHGKCDIFDPRTGRKSYTTNPALHAADILTDPTWGLGDNTVNQDQLVAAANVCDQTVACGPSQSLTEALYAGHWHYDASVGPGAVLNVFLKAMGGRVTRQGGEWFIWPAYWQGPTFAWEAGMLLEAPTWRPSRDLAQLCNRVRGKYIAPNYPYNVTGDLYDANGWFDGTIENNFPFGFQPSDFPEYAQDPLHGYATDLFLNEDSGALGAWASGTAYPAGAVVTSGTQIFLAIAAAAAGVAPVATAIAWNPGTAYTTGESVMWTGQVYTATANSTDAQPDTNPSSWTLQPWIPWARQLVLDLEFEAVLSVSQAQRLAKIALMRNRQQGSGTFKTKFATFAQAGIDTGYLYFSAMGWTEKLVELADEPTIAQEVQGSGDAAAPTTVLHWPVQETDPTVYDWDPATEELTVYDVPSSPQQAPYIPVAPTEMTLTSGASTAVEGADGVVIPRVLVAWDDPADIAVTQIVVQWRPHGTSAWIPGPVTAVGVGQAYVSGVVSGQVYDFQIASMRADGAMSPWLQALDYTVSATLSSVLSTGLNPNSPYNVNNDATLESVASDGYAEIEIYGPSGVGSGWTQYTGQGPVSYPAGTVGGLEFSTVYFVVVGAADGVPNAFTDYNSALNDEYVYVGSIVTCGSDGSGGGSGGGGGSGSGGGGPRGVPIPTE